MSTTRVGPLIAVLAIAASAAAVAVSAQIPAQVEIRVPKAPTVAVFGAGAFAVYELHVTNVSTDTITLQRLEVVDGSGGKTLLTAQDSVLLTALSRPGTPMPRDRRARVDPGLRAVIFVWLPVDAQHPPATLRQRISLRKSGADSASQVLDGGLVRVEAHPVAIGAPLRGEWMAANGPSNASGHRRSAIATNGTIAIAQRFAIDFVRVDSAGSSFRGDRSKNENFYAEGQDALAVADGIVVETKDSIPENTEGPASRAVPITLVTVGGNHVVVDIGHGRYAFYAHVKPGSLRVHVGDRVKRAQVLALVGNTGNSTEPHLHFHISDSLASGTSTLGSEGLPYTLPSFDVVGHCTIVTEIKCSRAMPVTVRGAMPMENEIVRFPK
ncbi:MAG: M23 family metallopeptidase [Gemmatimonadaceae bacterium]